MAVLCYWDLWIKITLNNSKPTNTRGIKYPVLLNPPLSKGKWGGGRKDNSYVIQTARLLPCRPTFYRKCKVLFCWQMYKRLCARRSFISLWKRIWQWEKVFQFRKYGHLNEKSLRAAFLYYSDGIINLLTPCSQKLSPSVSYACNEVHKVILAYIKRRTEKSLAS